MKTLLPRDLRELPVDFATLCVADVMQRDLITVYASDPLTEVERVLAEARISGVPVLDDNDEIVGVLSMADLVNRYAEDGDLGETANERDRDEDDLGDDDTEVVAFHRASGDQVCAGDVMTPELTYVAPTVGLREASRLMVQKQIHRLLVVENNRVVGLLTTLDILRAIAS